MPEIHLDHLLFTRVERSFSPRGTSGYQIVYQSPALAAEAAQIEKRLQCFQINNQGIIRYQFFWTDGGLAVCTRTVSLLAPDREVIDQHQRDAFLAHALVLSQADFARIRNDPFALFAAAEEKHILATDVAQLVEYLNGKALPECLYVHRRMQISAPLSGSQDELVQLYRLVESAATLSRQRQSLLMIASDPGDIFRFLSPLLLLLPTHERMVCTFDTFADSCVPIPGTYWTVGSTRPLGQGGFLPMYFAERQIVPIKVGVPDSLYSTWFLYAVQGLKSFAQLNEDLLPAQLIAESFHARTALPEDVLNERVLTTFCHLHRTFIEDCLINVLTPFMEQHIATVFAPWLFNTLSFPAVLNIAATGSYDIQSLAAMMYRWLLQIQPAWKDWDDVLNLAIRAAFAPLLLLASLKSHPRFLLKNYSKQQLQAIQSLQESNHLSQVLAELCGSAASVATGATSGEALPAWPVLDDEEFQTLVLALLQQKAGSLLQAACSERAALLQQRKILVSLLKAADKDGGAPEFIATLQQHPLYGK